MPSEILARIRQLVPGFSRRTTTGNYCGIVAVDNDTFKRANVREARLKPHKSYKLIERASPYLACEYPSVGQYLVLVDLVDA
jgi:hypothetical protein